MPPFVVHPAPDATSIAVHTPIGTILDTGDFKFDPTPVMGDPTDEKLLKKIGDKGVLALFSDTVRVETEGSTPSEKVVLETIDDVISLGGNSIAALGNANYRVASPSLEIVTSLVLGRHTLISFIEALQSLDESVADTIATLEAKGASFEHYPDIGRLEGHVHHSGGMKLVWLKDPDGNLIGIETAPG